MTVAAEAVTAGRRPASSVAGDALRTLKDADSARAASRGTPEASRFTGLCRRMRRSYLASTGV
jgi:hypothetical protein